MTLRLSCLELRISTDDGLFGVRIPFDNGLVVLRAENSMGKSTCVQSIIYALGLEGMLSAGHSIPLPHAMTQYLEDETGARHDVLESAVLLEILNGDGSALTVKRAIVSQSDDKRLIQTWLGPKLTHPENSYEKQDKYVRMEGAAARDTGFHHQLAAFLGWQLPPVTRYQGPPCPLYLETIFPLLVVEQKHGWSGIQSRMPTQFRIRDVGKRSTEFLLDLHEHEMALARQNVDSEMTMAKSSWTSNIWQLQQAADNLSAKIQNLPSEPTSDWPPLFSVEVMVPSGDHFTPLKEAISDDLELLKNLESEEIPRVEQVASQLSVKLKNTQDALAEAEVTSTSLARELNRERAQRLSIDRRLSALHEDLTKHKDIVRLRKMGSSVSLAQSSGECPTCHRPVTDSLIPSTSSPMTVEDNMALIREQISTFESMRDDAAAVLDSQEANFKLIRARLDSLRSEVRTQKRTLSSDGRAPSEAAIRTRLEAEQRLKLRQRAADTIETVLDVLSELSGSWRELLARKKELKSQYLCEDDRRKLRKLKDCFIEQLVEYEFRSIPPHELGISETSYRPEHDGFDLGFDLSASDQIRTVWAYIYGLLEVSREESTNHPGLLILDEPRQQSTSRVSFAAFVKRASTAGAAGQQILFATSEEDAVLQEALNGLPHQYLNFSGRILQRLPDSST